MEYEEFKKDVQFVDPENPYVNAYKDEEGNIYYVEPGFYYGLTSMKEKKADDFPRIMESLFKMVKQHHHVVFTADFESPFINKEGYVYKEIQDITDPLQIFVEDKSRGSDYGD